MHTDQFQTAPPDRNGFYERIAPIYDSLVGPFLRPVRNGVRQIARGLGCRRILDIACGTGEQVDIFDADGFTTVGIDLSPSMLSKARREDTNGPPSFWATPKICCYFQSLLTVFYSAWPFMK